MQKSCVPDQVRHPAVQPKHVPEILTFPAEQLATHVLASNNNTPEHVKQFVVVPLQVAQLTHASHPSPVLFAIYPSGQVVKQLFKWRIGLGVAQAVQLLVFPLHSVQLLTQACHILTSAIVPIGQGFIQEFEVESKFNVPVQVVQLLGPPPLQVAQVESHAIQVVPLS